MTFIDVLEKNSTFGRLVLLDSMLQLENRPAHEPRNVFPSEYYESSGVIEFESQKKKVG